MGGLLAKKACVLVRSISAIIFLSNRPIVVSFQSARNIIADVNRSSMTLEELTDSSGTLRRDCQSGHFTKLY